MANPKLKIGIYQSQLPNPSIHVTVTDNARYFEERFTTTSIKTALDKIENWLRRNYEESNSAD
jgi:hypothetical protein